MNDRLKKYGNAFELLARRPSPLDVRRIQFAVTFLCNCRCTMCNIWKTEKDDSKPELTLDQIRHIFSGRPFLKKLSVIDLTGGEPFLRNDFSEICDFFLRSFPKARLLITTNGMATTKIIDSMSQVLKSHSGDRIELSISLDGTEDTHDKMRGITGTHAAAIATAKAARKAGVGKVTFSFTLTPQNAGQVMDAYDFARSSGFGFTTVRFAQESFYYQNPGLHSSWSMQERQEAVSSIRALIKARRAEPTSLNAMRDIRFLKRQIGFSQDSKRNCDCYSGSHSFYLDPYGTVYPCVMLERHMGNVIEQGVEAVWYGERAREVRKLIQKRECNCLTECETFLSMQRDPKEIYFTLTDGFLGDKS